MAEFYLDSRKRAFSVDHDDTDYDHEVKRSNTVSLDDVTVLVKILIPSASAGVILGKGGETIIKLQTQFCANIKMSKAGDYFPGTTDRVCVILGSPSCVRSLLGVIIDKIRDKPDAHGAPSDLRVKLIVPHSTASMIVGKGGEYVSRIKNETSVNINLSPKGQEPDLPEKCITVQGSPDGMSRALDMILEKIVSDPSSNSCSNVSYSETQPNAHSLSLPGASNIHTGIIPNRPSFVMLRMSLRAFGFAEPAIEEVVAAVYTLVSYGFLVLSEEGVEGHSFPVAHNNRAHTQPGRKQQSDNGRDQFSSSAVDNSSSSYGACNYSGMQTSCVPDTVCHSGGPYYAPTDNYSGMPSEPLVNSAVSAASMYGSPPAGRSLYGDSNMAAYPAPMASYGCYNSGTVSACYDQSNSYNNYYVNNGTGYSTAPSYFPTTGSILPPPPPPPPPPSVNDTALTTTTNTLEVGEHIVDTVFGPEGCYIAELQTWSGASIHVSPKGAYTPGTTNRIATVTGTALAVQSAVCYLRQCIQQAESQHAGWSHVNFQTSNQAGILSAATYYPLPGQPAQ